jgi:hypothetical protein
MKKRMFFEKSSQSARIYFVTLRDEKNYGFVS